MNTRPPRITAPRYPDLKNKTAIVTGAAGGVGREVCRCLAIQGARVFATDVDTSSLQELDQNLIMPQLAGLFAVDLSEPSASHLIHEKAMQVLGGVDILVNNAALFKKQTLDELSSESLNKTLAVNVLAPIRLTQLVVSSMRSRGGGAIVNVASVAVRTGGATDVLAYTASKGALVAASRAMARSLSPAIRVNAVLPAAIDTRMLRLGFDEREIRQIIRQIPLGRLADPAEIAAVICWLCTDQASYVTGASIDVNGGWVMG